MQQMTVVKRQLGVLCTGNDNAARHGRNLSHLMSTDRQRITELEQNLNDAYVVFDEITERTNDLTRQRDKYAFEKQTWRIAALIAAALLGAVLAVTAVTTFWRWE
jgi:hypothetical protein